MSNSHKNTSMGGHGVGDKGAHYSHIGHKKEAVPPPGASNSYEKVRQKIDRRDDHSLSKGHYTREKMANK